MLESFCKFTLMYKAICCLVLIALSVSVNGLSDGEQIRGKHKLRGEILLESAARHAHLSGESKQAVQETIRQIEVLSQGLFKEEVELLGLKTSRRKLVQGLGWNWWFKTHDRLKVAETDLKIRDHERIVENIREDVDLHWKQLKPYFGVYSELFVYELVSFFPYAGIVLLEMTHAVLELGLIALIIGGPALVILILAISSFFGTLSFLFFGAPVFVASFLWIAHLPFVIIEYGPSFLDFFAVYIPSVFVFGSIALMALRLTRRKFDLQAEFTPRHTHQD